MNDFNDNKDAIKDKTGKLAEQGKEQALDLYNKSKDKVEPLTESCKETVSDFYHQGKEAIQSAEDFMSESSTQLCDSIKENPLTAVLVAGAIGWFASKLLSK